MHCRSKYLEANSSRLTKINTYYFTSPGRVYMTNAFATAPSMSTLDDDAWDDLLNFIEERRVIPIVGPELLMVSTDRGPHQKHNKKNIRLATRLNVNSAELPRPD